MALIDGARPLERPNAIIVLNPDQKMNMYDISIQLTETGPTAPGSPWLYMLQQEVINLPMVVSNSNTTASFNFLSKMTDIDVRVEVSTRMTKCWGSFDLYHLPNHGWVNDGASMHQNGKEVYQIQRRFSPGLALSKPDSQ